MAAPNSAKFPDNVAAVVGDLANPGVATFDIFEMREAVIRIMAAWGMIRLYRQTGQPGAPSIWDFWLTPGILSNGEISGSDLRVYDGTSWVDVTPELFAMAMTATANAMTSVSVSSPITGNGLAGNPVAMPAASPTQDGYMSKEDKAKLDAIEPAATADLTGGEIATMLDAHLGAATWRN